MDRVRGRIGVGGGGKGRKSKDLPLRFRVCCGFRSTFHLLIETKVVHLPETHGTQIPNVDIWSPFFIQPTLLQTSHKVEILQS